MWRRILPQGRYRDRVASRFAAVIRRATGSTPCLILLVALLAPLGALETSEPARLAAKSLLLDLTRAGDQLVAVGDRGHVLLSSDDGRTWTQSPTPTRALLTGVSFPDARHGWAVGHDGVILVTMDAGRTWARQDDGKDLETIWLDVLFVDAQRGYVVGAYGKFQLTSDGGKTWTVAKPSAGEVHFNRLSAGPGGYLYLAGESGTALASADGGKVWNRLEVPYDGSLFGLLPLDGAHLLAYGLRGHILRSDDGGATWAPLNSDFKVLIMGGVRLRSGGIVLAGQGGHFFLSHDDGHSFQHWKPEDFGTSVADLLEAADGTIIAVGDAGVTKLPRPQP